MRQRAVASAVIVLGTLFLASVALANYPDEGVGVGSTETWVMNVHETLDANVVVSFLDQDGQQTWSTESTIAPLGNDSFPASSSELESGWLGSMTIDSLRPIENVTFEQVRFHDQVVRDAAALKLSVTNGVGIRIVE